MSNLTDHQRTRRTKNLYSWSSGLLIIGSLLLVNFIVGFFVIRLDTSEGKIYSISQGSKDLLEKLEDPLIIRLVFSSQLPAQFKLNEQYSRDLLSEYKRASHGKIKIEYIDPSKSPKARNQAVQSGVQPVQLDIRKQGRREVAECFMGLSIIYGTKFEPIPFIQDTQGLEYEITQRIKKLINPTRAKAGVVSNAASLNFDEGPLAKLSAALNDSYDVVNINLNEAIPDDIKILLIIGPEAEFTQDELSAFKKYIEAGGTALLLIDQYAIDVSAFSAAEKSSGIENLLNDWGITFEKALVVDPQADRIQIQSTQGNIKWMNLVEFPYFPLAVDLDRKNPALRDIDGASFPFVSPFIINQEVSGIKALPLIKSSDRSWLDPSPEVLSPIERYTPPVGAKEGPFNLALYLEGQFKPGAGETDKPGRVIMLGTSRLIRTDFPPRQQNFSLFFNLIDWAVQDESLLSIRANGAPIRPLKNIRPITRAIVKYSLMTALPLFSLVLGFIMWRRQKTRRLLHIIEYQVN